MSKRGRTPWGWRGSTEAPWARGRIAKGGGFAGDASRHGYALVDKRLFMPEKWFGEDSAPRRAKCNVPEEVTFHTKPQLAAAMLQTIAQEGLLPFKYVVADCL